MVILHLTAYWLSGVKKYIVLIPLIFLLSLQGCSEGSLSAEDEIKLFIERGITAAENRSTNELSELINSDYLDEKGMNKDQLIKLLRLYFFRNKNIFLFKKIKDITIYSNTEASVILYMAMAGKVINTDSLLSGFRGKIFRLEFDLEKQDQWLLKQAKWQPASVVDIQ